MTRILPNDVHNQNMADLVHPSDWSPPAVSGDSYNLVVVGGGTAGLIAALGTAGLGGRVALIEKHFLGGDCLVTGCVPSKGLLSAAHVAHQVRQAGDYGVRIDGDVTVDFGAVMERMRKIRADIAHHDAAQKLKDAGVDVFFGAGTFTGPDTLEVNGTSLRFAKAVIATGARALRPAIPGIDDVGVIDNEGVFELTELPERMVVVGAGPIGCELGQAFRRFGSEVTLVDMAPRILNHDDADAAAIVANQLESEGITLATSAKVLRFETDGADKIVVFERHGREERLAADTVLLAIGRAPNVDGIGLEAAEVAFTRKGIEVNDGLQTSNPRIYASGDVASKFKFTHAADALSRIAVQNALFFGRKKASDLVIPWSTFTDPELSHVGIGQTEAAKRGDLSVFEVGFDHNDRSLLEGEATGFARVYADKKGRILGATVVGRHAGEVIAPLTLAMTNGVTLGQIASTIHAYPTRMDIVKRLGDSYNRTRLTPFVATLLKTLLAWRR
ncbi:MAG: mercuric reductase [Proteobacteria bacterium]|nr:mercuric reductase [Pseudomonadota bacterium]